MLTIWKFPLVRVNDQLLHLPRGAEPLSVQLQNNEICIWFRVNFKGGDKEKVFRKVYIYGTGHPCEASFYLDYVGTVQDGEYVWHVFCEREPHQ